MNLTRESEREGKRVREGSRKREVGKERERSRKKERFGRLIGCRTLAGPPGIQPWLRDIMKISTCTFPQTSRSQVSKLERESQGRAWRSEALLSACSSCELWGPLGIYSSVHTREGLCFQVLILLHSAVAPTTLRIREVWSSHERRRSPVT